MVEKGKAFRIFSNVLMILIGICSIAPFLLLIMSSVTDEQSLVSNGYSFFPKEYSLSTKAETASCGTHKTAISGFTFA